MLHILPLRNIDICTFVRVSAFIKALVYLHAYSSLCLLASFQLKRKVKFDGLSEPFLIFHKCSSVFTANIDTHTHIYIYECVFSYVHTCIYIYDICVYISIYM